MQLAVGARGVDTEIHELGDSLARDHDAREAQAAMGRDQRLPGVVARAVHGVQCGPNVERDPERDAKGQPVAARRCGMMKIGKADTVQPLGHDEERSAILPDVENLEHVRMRDRGRDPSFVEETARERRIGRWRDDGLEGDWAGDPWFSVGARPPNGDRAGSL